MDNSEVKNAADQRVVRLLHITRLIRILRVARIVRFIRALSTLLFSIAYTMKQVFWAFFLLFTIVYIMGVIFSQGVHNYATENVSSRLPDALQQYWGTLPRGMFSLFLSVSGGISWVEVITPLHDLGWNWVLAFILYVVMTVFSVLNVITGVFCESAIEGSRQDSQMVTQALLENRERYMKQIKSLFESMDEDGSGVVTFAEMEQHLSTDKARAVFEALQLEIADVWELFKLLDNDGTAEIEPEEFFNGCMRLRGTASAIDVAKLTYDARIFNRKAFAF